MLKKTLFLSLCLIMLLTASLSGQRLIFEDADSYIFYSGQYSSNARVITAVKSNALTVKSSIKKLSGESAVYNKTGIAEKLLKDFDASVVMTERTGEVVSVYAYTKKIKNYIIINGKRVNLHIAQSKNQTAVGTPIIFGGY